ncbi:MAG: hypothetical protein IKF35_08680 [Solobacterium sp.]|nr:hypothetical protein [Solobacterium sp.]
MRNWHSLYEVLQFPIGVLFAAMFLLGLGNLLSNPAFSSLISVHNTIILALAEAMIRIGSFLVTNYPLLFLIRLVTRKAGSATSIISALSGYVTYLVMTMCFAPGSLPSTAYSSILGLSTASVNVVGATGGVRYPLQTGVFAAAIVSALTLWCFSRSRHHSEYGLFSFISKDVWCVIQTVLVCMLAGAAMAFVWPYVIRVLQSQIRFISTDTTNPMNLMMYGILDRVTSVLNLNAVLRNPFWYGVSGGSWISMAGANLIGDVTIWTAQLSSSNLNGMAGRFITPYYVLNIFALPGMLWGMFSIRTDKVDRRRMLMFYIVATLISMFAGVILPLELTLVLLCPLLFAMHLLCTGIFFGVFQAMHVYLGFNYTGSGTMAVMPGTLPEFLTYLANPHLRRATMTVALIGACSFVLYFFMTRLYFRYLALDLFHVGDRQRLVNGTIEAVGGVSNIKMTQSSQTRLVVSLYDPTKLNAARLRQLGSVRVYETKAGYAISYGSASTMVRMGISQAIRNTIRPGTTRQG